MLILSSVFITDSGIKTRLGASALRTRKPARGTRHVLIAKMAAKPIPIKQSCLNVSESMFSSWDLS